jgi:hypothetical protein
MLDHCERALNHLGQVEELFVYPEVLGFHLSKVKQVEHQIFHHLGRVLHQLDLGDDLVDLCVGSNNIVALLF